MRRVLMTALLLASCAGENPQGERFYDNNDVQLAVGNGALMTCSCMFVMEMPEDYCRAWVKASPNVARLGIDTVNKTVESSAFVSWSAKAHWVDAKRGCVLE
jgi:hypothetical protein